MKCPPNPPVPPFPPKPVTLPAVTAAPTQRGEKPFAAQTKRPDWNPVHESEAHSSSLSHASPIGVVPGFRQTPQMQTAGLAQRSAQRSPIAGRPPHMPMPSLAWRGRRDPRGTGRSLDRRRRHLLGPAACRVPRTGNRRTALWPDRDRTGPPPADCMARRRAGNAGRWKREGLVAEQPGAHVAVAGDLAGQQVQHGRAGLAFLRRRPAHELRRATGDSAGRSRSNRCKVRPSFWIGHADPRARRQPPPPAGAREARGETGGAAADAVRARCAFLGKVAGLAVRDVADEQVRTVGESVARSGTARDEAGLAATNCRRGRGTRPRRRRASVGSTVMRPWAIAPSTDPVAGARRASRTGGSPSSVL